MNDSFVTSIRRGQAEINELLKHHNRLGMFITDFKTIRLSDPLCNYENVSNTKKV